MAHEREKKSTKTAASRRQTSPPGFLTVGQTARILGVSTSTLRLWENMGLILPARSSGRFRLYSPEMLKVLKRIKYLRNVQRLSVRGIKAGLGKNLLTTTHKGTAATDVGGKLRRLRERNGLTLVEAAGRAGVSAGFLSSIELSRANASIATLHRLTAVYDTTVLQLFEAVPQPVSLVRAGERKAIETDSGVRMELLSPGSKMLECHLFRISPGDGSNGAYSHEGEEFIYVLSGNLEIWLDEMECHLLQEGDCLTFKSHLGHRWLNPSTEDAVLIWVNTPPTF